MKIAYKNYLTLAGAAAFVQGVLFLLSPILTRLFTPADFGGYGMMLGVAALLAAVGTGRLEHAIPVAHGLAESIRVAALGLALAVATAFVAGMVILGGECAQLWRDSTWNGLPLMLVPAMVVALAAFQLINALLLKQKAYSSVGRNKVMQGLSTGVLQLALGWLGAGSAGLMVAQALGYLAGCATGARGLILRALAQVRGKGVRLTATLSSYRRYPLLMTPAALFNQASQQVPLLAIGYLYGLHEAGLYALVMRVCGAPLSLVGQAVAQVYAAEFISHASAGPSHLARHYIALLVRLAAIGILVVAVLVVGLKAGDQFLFGRDWGRLGDVAMYLSLMLVVDFVATPVATTLGYLGRQREQLLWDVGRLCAVSAVFLYASATALSYEGALLAHASMWCACLLLHVWITWRACAQAGNGTNANEWVRR